MRGVWAFTGVMLTCAAVPAMAADKVPDQKLTLARGFRQSRSVGACSRAG